MKTLDGRQLACLASPTRNEVFAALRKAGRASVRELAEEMGRTPEVLHYHVNALLKAGLIEVVERRPTARKPESVYTPAAESYRLPDLRRNPELASITRKAISAGVRNALRGYLAAAERAVEDESIRDFLQVIRATARLSPDDAQEFMEMLEEASRFARDRETQEGVRLHWSSLVFPDSHSRPGAGTAESQKATQSD